VDVAKTEFVRRAHRQRPKQERVHDGEDGSVYSDRDAEYEERYKGRPWVFDESAERAFDIAPCELERRLAWVGYASPRLSDVAANGRRLTARVAGRVRLFAWPTRARSLSRPAVFDPMARARAGR
jgi:hypothetical protein